MGETVEGEGMKKIKEKQERTPEEGNRLRNVYVTLVFV
jgi:hypothetical protein